MPDAPTSQQDELLRQTEQRIARRRAAEGIASPPSCSSSPSLHIEVPVKDTGKDTGKNAAKSPEMAREARGNNGGPFLRKDGDWWVEGLGAGDSPESNSAIPLTDYILEAAARNRSSFERLYEDSDKVAGDPQHYRSPCTVFVAFLKSRSEFTAFDGYDAASFLDGLLADLVPGADDPWCELLPNQDTFDHEIHPRDSVIDLWDRILAPIDLVSPGLRRAEELAERFPVRSRRYTHFRDQSYLRVISLAYWLARLTKGHRFFLSCRDAGEFAKCSHTQASLFLKRGQRDLLLGLKQKSRRTGEASEYSFNLALVGADSRQQ